MVRRDLDPLRLLLPPRRVQGRRRMDSRLCPVGEYGSRKGVDRRAVELDRLFDAATILLFWSSQQFAVYFTSLIP